MEERARTYFEAIISVWMDEDSKNSVADSETNPGRVQVHDRLNYGEDRTATSPGHVHRHASRPTLSKSTSHRDVQITRWMRI